MPFVDAEPGPPESLPPAPAPGPSLGDVAGAALRDSNSVVSIYRGLANSGPLAPTPGYSAADLLKSRPDLYEHRFRLAGAQSQGQADAIVADIDQQTADKTTLAAAGPMGYVVGAGMGLFEPTNLLPGRVAVRAWQEGRGALKGAIEMGAAMAVQSTAQEAALQASQEGRPLSESVLSVGSSTLLGAFLGGAASWLSRGEAAAIAGKMDRERAVNDAHVAGAQQGFKVGDSVHVETGGVRQTKEPVKVTDIQEKDGVRYYQTDFEGSKAYVPESGLVAAGEPAAAREPAMGGAPAGAAAADTRTMEDLTMVPTGIGAEKLPGNIITRVLQYSSLAARRLATELAETAVLVKGNLEGKTTTPNGLAPIETMTKLEQNVAHTKILRSMEEAWKDTNFGAAENAPWFAKLRDEFSSWGVPSPARVTFEDFSKQVGDAVMFDKKSDEPAHPARRRPDQADLRQVVGTRRAVGRGLQARRAGRGRELFPALLEQVDDPGQALGVREQAGRQVSRRPGCQRGDAGPGWLLPGRAREHEGNIKKYTGQLEKKQGDLADDELLQEEVRRQAKAVYPYAESLREGQYKNVGGIRVEDPDKNIEKARGGATFETRFRERGNTLADRASAHRAEIADLEEKLQAEHASAAAMRAKIEEEIGKWHGQSTAEAKSAIKAREKYEAEREAKRAPGEPKGGRLTSADEAVDRAADRMLNSPQDKTEQELRDDAHETVRRILGSPDGRLPYEEGGSLPQLPQAATPPLRGSLHERALDVNNEWAHDWIERESPRCAQALHADLRAGCAARRALRRRRDDERYPQDRG